MASKKKAGKGRGYRVAGGSDAARTDRSVLGSLIWIACLGTWAFLACSLVSFSPGDAPSHVVWPHNNPVENWCGPTGAYVAYFALKVLGLGVLVPMLFGGAGLALTAARIPTGHGLVRLVGIVMLTGAACGLAALAWPNWGPMAGLAGGTSGVVIAGELVPRFAVGGTLLWMMLLVAVGLVVACDTLLWRAPIALYRVMVPAAHGTRVAAGVGGRAAGGVARASGGVFGSLSGLVKKRKTARVRLNDIDEPVEVDEKVL